MDVMQNVFLAQKTNGPQKVRHSIFPEMPDTQTVNVWRIAEF